VEEGEGFSHTHCLQVQWLCSRANGGREFNMHEVMAGVVDDVKVRWLIRS